jgi:hypothetical protein
LDELVLYIEEFGRMRVDGNENGNGNDEVEEIIEYNFFSAARFD